MTKLLLEKGTAGYLSITKTSYYKRLRKDMKPDFQVLMK